MESDRMRESSYNLQVYNKHEVRKSRFEEEKSFRSRRVIRKAYIILKSYISCVALENLRSLVNYNKNEQQKRQKECDRAFYSSWHKYTAYIRRYEAKRKCEKRKVQKICFSVVQHRVKFLRL